MKKSLLILAVSLPAVSALFLSSCGTSAAPIQITTVLEGSWANSSCASPNKKRTTFVFSGTSFTRTAISYSDTSCATPAITITQTGTIGIGSAVTTPTSATAINFTTSTITATPATGQAAALNTTFACGVGVTFTDNTATDIAGKNCSGTPTGALEPAVGAIGYNIFSLVTTTTPNTFTIGNGSSATVSSNLLGAATAATIPTVLDSTTVFSKYSLQ